MSALLSILLTVIPVIDAPVVDQAGVLSAQASTSISTKLREHREATGVQLAVLIVETTDGISIDDYAQQVTKQWRGGSKERDDGAVFVLAVKDRTMRLELGYGLEALIPDSTASALLQALRPALREANYDAAVSSLVDSFVARTTKGAEANVIAETQPVLSHGQELALTWLPFPLVPALFGLLGFLVRKRHDEAGVSISQGTKLEPFHLLILHALAVALFTGVMLLFGLGFGVWWPAFTAGLLGYHRERINPLYSVGIFVFGSMVISVCVSGFVSNQLDAAIFTGLIQGVFFVVTFFQAIDFEFVSLESDQDREDRRRVNSMFGSSPSSSSTSSWGSSSSSSSSGSSSSGSKSSSSGGYSGGGGTFGGGGASSNW